MSDEDHDPFNEPELAHQRARELLVEDFFWDCTDEEALFGSDEGHDAYFEYRSWRTANPQAPLVDCLAWILEDRLDEYTLHLCSEERVRADLAEPDEAFMADSWDTFTLDATIIATAFGQLLDEGRIDPSAKPYVNVALTRQLHPAIVTSERRAAILNAAARVLTTA
jgi:uncharacterized protein YfeS